MKRVHPIAATLCVVLFVLIGCDPSVETVEHTTDQTKLAKIAVEDKNDDVRRTAVKKLTDQALLAKIAVEDKVGAVRRTAVENLTDQTKLAKIAVEDKDWNVRYAAVKKLTDQALLAKIAMEAKVDAVRRTAAEPEKEFELVPAQLFHQRDGLGNVFEKLNAGQAVRIAYFGGSITAAAGWRVKTLKWFQDTYPQAKVSEINAAIGGTGSDLGVYRFQQDVLQHRPDLIFVEFSGNDGGAAPETIWRAMEGIVRQAWKADPTIDFCYVYTFSVGYEQDLNQGLCPRATSADEVLADYYGLPAINVALRTAELAQEGQLLYTPQKDEQGQDRPVPEGVVLFSTDGVHPLDAGHELYAQVIAEALKQMAPNSKAGPHVLKPPFMADNWEDARLVPLEPGMLSSGWKKLSPTKGLGGAFHSRLPEIWEATQPGKKISFQFKGTAVKLYDLVGPDGGQAVCTLDGKTGPPQPRFDGYCTYHRLASLTIGKGLEDTVHTVTVEIHPEQPDRRSVVNQEKDKPGFDPKKYEGTVLRVGSIMLMGEIVR